jgi:hypothetical protein
MAALKGIIGVTIMITFGVAVFLLLAATKITVLTFRFLNRRVLDQF